MTAGEGEMFRFSRKQSPFGLHHLTQGGQLAMGGRGKIGVPIILSAMVSAETTASSLGAQ